jgi:hypothetical protein
VGVGWLSTVFLFFFSKGDTEYHPCTLRQSVGEIRRGKEEKKEYVNGECKEEGRYVTVSSFLFFIFPFFKNTNAAVERAFAEPPPKHE